MRRGARRARWLGRVVGEHKLAMVMLARTMTAWDKQKEVGTKAMVSMEGGPGIAMSVVAKRLTTSLLMLVSSVVKAGSTVATLLVRVIRPMVKPARVKVTELEMLMATAGLASGRVMCVVIRATYLVLMTNVTFVTRIGRPEALVRVAKVGKGNGLQVAKERRGPWWMSMLHKTPDSEPGSMEVQQGKNRGQAVR